MTHSLDVTGVSPVGIYCTGLQNLVLQDTPRNLRGILRHVGFNLKSIEIKGLLSTERDHDCRSDCATRSTYAAGKAHNINASKLVCLENRRKWYITSSLASFHFGRQSLQSLPNDKTATTLFDSELKTPIFICSAWDEDCFLKYPSLVQFHGNMNKAASMLSRKITVKSNMVLNSINSNI